MRILIADDDRVCCQALMMYLSLLGEVETAGTGRQAIDAVRSAHDADKPYGLIFLGSSLALVAARRFVRRKSSDQGPGPV